MAQEEEKEVKAQEESEEEENKEESEEELSESEEEVEQQPMELPPVSFENFVFGLYNTALFHLGIRDPETGALIQNLPVARHTIDTLGMLQEKTKGNLTAPESNLMENLLYELRMNYLRSAKQAEAAPEEETKAEEKTTEPKEETEEVQEASDNNS